MSKYSVDGLSFIDTGVNEETIIFLHGWGQNKETFHFYITNLKVQYRCISIDLPGFGKSVCPKEKLSIDEYGEIINDFINAYHLQVKAIIGHSFGGKIATNMLIKKKVSQAILLAPSSIKPKRSIKTKIKIKLYKILKKRYGLKLKIKYGSNDYRNAKGVLREIFVEAVNTFYNEELKAIHSSVLIIWGKKDEETPVWMGEKMNRLIPNCTFEVIDSGHFSYLEKKYQCMKYIQKYLEENKCL